MGKKKEHNTRRVHSTSPRDSKTSKAKRVRSCAHSMNEFLKNNMERACKVFLGSAQPSHNDLLEVCTSFHYGPAKKEILMTTIAVFPLPHMHFLRVQTKPYARV
jgi:hypothetical protein